MAAKARSRERETDICIIGSGPSGSMVAYELSRLGYSVVVLEKGRYLPPDTLELGNNRLPESEWDSHVMNAVSSNDTGKSVRTIPTMVGGGGEVYGGASHRFLPADFQLFSKLGSLSNASLADWPFTYEDLEPFYTRVELLLGVSGSNQGAKYPPPRSAPYPLPPLKVDAEAVRLFDLAAEKLGLHSHPTPLAILSEPYDGRSPCVECGYCVGNICLYSAKSSPTVTTLRHAVKTGRCQIVSGANVHRLRMQGTAANEVEYSDEFGNQHRLQAKIFVLACGAIFTPHLLLSSVSDRFPHGVGNHSDLLGRYFCSHVIGLTPGRFKKSVYPANIHYVLRTIDDGYFGEGRVWKGGALQLHLNGGLPHHTWQTNSSSFGPALKERMKAETGSTPIIYYCGDTLPQRSNRVLLSNESDRFGNPTCRVEFKFHSLDRLSAQYGYMNAKRLFVEMGADQVTTFKESWGNNWVEGYHYSGTCRAGVNPAESVVDRDCRVHETDNVYVCDGSIFPTSGGFNPTLTIQANALRVASKIAQTFNV